MNQPPRFVLRGKRKRDDDNDDVDSDNMGQAPCMASSTVDAMNTDDTQSVLPQPSSSSDDPMQIDDDMIQAGPTHKRHKVNDVESSQIEYILAQQQHYHHGDSGSTASPSSGWPLTGTVSSPSSISNHLVSSQQLRPSDQCVPSPSDTDRTVHDVIRRFWGLKADSVPYNPSPNPVSITRNDLIKLAAQPYVATEKSDGVRYLLILCRHMYSGQRIAVMMNRACTKYAVGIVADDAYFDGTIFDGELVWSAQHQRLIYLVFDAVACRGQEVRQRNYAERNQIVKHTFSDPNQYPVLPPDQQLVYAETMAQQGKIVAIDGSNHLCIQPKPYYAMNQIASVWQKIQSQTWLPYANDGLILTPLHEPVGCRTHWSQFKWKPHHTIDLQLRLAYMPVKTDPSVPPLSTASGDNRQWMAALFFGDDRQLVDGVVVNQLPYENACRGVMYKDRQVRFVIEPNGVLQRMQQHLIEIQVYAFACIVECSATITWSNNVIQNTGQQVAAGMVYCTIQRIRNDKVVPNNHFTVLQTLKNIEENIGMDELVGAVQPQSSYRSVPQ